MWRKLVHQYSRAVIQSLMGRESQSATRLRAVAEHGEGPRTVTAGDDRIPGVPVSADAASRPCPTCRHAATYGPSSLAWRMPRSIGDGDKAPHDARVARSVVGCGLAVEREHASIAKCVFERGPDGHRTAVKRNARRIEGDRAPYRLVGPGHFGPDLDVERARLIGIGHHRHRAGTGADRWGRGDGTRVGTRVCTGVAGTMLAGTTLGAAATGDPRPGVGLELALEQAARRTARPRTKPSSVRGNLGWIEIRSAPFSLGRCRDRNPTDAGISRPAT